MPETVSVPALIVVSPVYVLAPEKVNIPEPAFSKEPKPKMTKEMGYISNVKDARKSLENIFKNS